MKLFQFWHAETPPADVGGLMATVQAEQTGFDYVRLDARSARAFIEAHYAARELAVWDACVLPVMWSDFLRLLLLETYGGVYADATYRFDGDLSAFVASAPVAQLPIWGPLVNGNYMMFREPGHPLIRAFKALLMENVEQRRFDSALMATGPGVLNSVRCIVSPDDRAAIESLTRINTDWMAWGWDESVAAAARLIPADPETTRAYRAITLVELEELHKIGVSVLDVEHRRSENYWFHYKGPLYR